MKDCLVSFFMVAIINEKLIPIFIVFDSTHGHPTQGTIYCKDNITLSFRFRSYEFKVDVIKGIDTQYLGSTLHISYHFNRDNIDEEFIRNETVNFLDWSNVIMNDYTQTKAIKPIKEGHCYHCNDKIEVVGSKFCNRCRPIVIAFANLELQ